MRNLDLETTGVVTGLTLRLSVTKVSVTKVTKVTKVRPPTRCRR